MADRDWDTKNIETDGFEEEKKKYAGSIPSGRATAGKLNDANEEPHGDSNMTTHHTSYYDNKENLQPADNKISDIKEVVFVSADIIDALDRLYTWPQGKWAKLAQTALPWAKIFAQDISPFSALDNVIQAENFYQNNVKKFVDKTDNGRLDYSRVPPAVMQEYLWKVAKIPLAFNPFTSIGAWCVDQAIEHQRNRTSLSDYRRQGVVGEKIGGGDSLSYPKDEIFSYDLEGINLKDTFSFTNAAVVPSGESIAAAAMPDNRAKGIISDTAPGFAYTNPFSNAYVSPYDKFRSSGLNRYSALTSASLGGTVQAAGSTSTAAQKQNTAAEKELNLLARFGEIIQSTPQEAWKQIENDAQKHLQNVLQGTESFSQAFKNVWHDMAVASGNILKQKLVDTVQSYLREKLLQPIQTYFQGLFDKTIGSWLGNLLGRADGGTVESNTPYIIGERGPELFVPQSTGTIVPNHQLTLGNTADKPVTVNVVNKTGVQASASAKTSFDGQRYVVDVFLDAYARNINGMRDVLAARR